VAAFSIILVAFQYNLTCVVRPRYRHGGQLYPTALEQLFTGLYVLELCCAGLFLLNRGGNNVFSCIGQAVITIVTLGCTAIFQLFLRQGFRPLLSQKPFPPAQQDYRGAKSSLDEPDRSKSAADDSALHQDPAFLSKAPTVWVPQDDLGVAQGELRSSQKLRTTIALSNENARIDSRGRITVVGNPPVSGQS